MPVTKKRRPEESRSITRYLSILDWLPRYRRQWLRADLLAGMTVWALVVPQAIAYASIAGLPPEAGLFTTFAGLLGYVLVGTSRQLIVSPTSSTAIISAALVAPLAAGDGDDYARLSAALALLCGLAFLILGLWKLGFISQFIATAVQAGFMFGLGLTIIVGQTGKLLGLSLDDGTFLEQCRDLAMNVSDVHGWTMAVGLGSLGALLLIQRFMPGVPAALLVVATSIAISYFLDLEGRGVAVVGDVSRTVPEISVPFIGFNDFVSLLPGVLAIAVINYAESDTVAEQFATNHRYRIRPDQELLALGAANGLAGLFQGFITGGGASQSAANDRAGARSQASALVVSGLTVLTLLFLLPVFQDLPAAVLGAIVISAVIGFFQVPEIRRIRRLRRDSFALALVALAGVIVLGIMPGLLVAITLSILMLLNRLSRPRDSILGRLAGSSAYVDASRHADVERAPGLLIYRLDAPLLFINANTMRDRIQTCIEQADVRPGVVVADMSFSDELDIKGADMLTDVRRDLADQGIELWLAELRSPAAETLRSAKSEPAAARWRVYATVDHAVRAYRLRRENVPAVIRS